MSIVVGWTSAYDGKYPTVTLTDDRKKALVERIRKREYYFTQFDHEFLPYGCPFYDDGVLCVLTKPQWDTVINEAYKDSHPSQRLMPMDVITRPPKNSVLYEKEKFEPKGDKTNG
jgi:hypothetical protein